MDAIDLRKLMERGDKVIIVDVRSAEEFAGGHIETAINIPVEQLAAQASELPTDAVIVTVCNFGGSRSCAAAELLQTTGYGNAVRLVGGINGWQEGIEESDKSVAKTIAAKH